MAIRDLIEAELEQAGVVDTRRRNSVAVTVRRMVARGLLTRVLPSIYASTDHATDASTRVAAVAAWAPRAVLVGRTAWEWLHEKTLTLPLTVVLPHHVRTPTWLVARQQALPPDEVSEVRGVRCASAGHAATDLAAEDRGRTLFDALRTRSVESASLPFLGRCFRGSRGQRSRAEQVRRAVTRPWSFAESELQQLLLEAGLTDWVANHAFVLEGRRLVVDLYFPDAHLAVEFDSWEFHSAPEDFEHDRARMNDLALLGLPHLHITWTMLTEDRAGVLALIRGALTSARAGDDHVA